MRAVDSAPRSDTAHGEARRFTGSSHAPTWYRRPSGLKMVMWRSYPAPLPRDIVEGRVDRARRRVPDEMCEKSSKSERLRHRQTEVDG
jgi:hypothetical protein